MPMVEPLSTPSTAPHANAGRLALAVGLLRTMRPRQWAKNGFVFMGALFDGQLLTWVALTRVGGAFVTLCLAASAIYLVNDVVDRHKDRLHPKKRFRAVAAGVLPVPIALGAAAVLAGVALALGLVLDGWLAVVVVVYVLLHLAYSFWLKRVVLLDVFAIAAGFVLRVLAGVVVVDVQQFSPWLYVCTGLLALVLAVGKRRQELVLLAEDAGAVRDTLGVYNLPLLDDILRLSTTSTAIAYTLYATEARTVIARPQWMLLTVPFVFYGLFRYLYLLRVRGIGGDPTEALYEDRPLQVSIVLWGMVVLALIYTRGG